MSLHIACLFENAITYRLLRGEDAKVAYERAKGKKPTTMGLEFGEKLL